MKLAPTGSSSLGEPQAKRPTIGTRAQRPLERASGDSETRGKTHCAGQGKIATRQGSAEPPVPQSPPCMASHSQTCGPQAVARVRSPRVEHRQTARAICVRRGAPRNTETRSARNAGVHVERICWEPPRIRRQCDPNLLSTSAAAMIVCGQDVTGGCRGRRSARVAMVGLRVTSLQRAAPQAGRTPKMRDRGTRWDS
jgi:hypothetical protein